MRFVSVFNGFQSVIALLIGVCTLIASGCGTTRWSDTARTGTEQLLISNAIDVAVSRIDFSPMGEKKSYVKSEAIDSATDHKYITMVVRQRLAASGAVICDSIDDADYVVEIRAGAVGTDRDDVLVGIPAITIPGLPGTSTTSTTIPEIPFIKRTNQRGVAKLAVFAYNKQTGRPFWASGNNQSESNARNLWIAGTGPLTKGTIYNKTTFAGHSVPEFMESQDGNPKSFADQAMIFPETRDDVPVKVPPKVEKTADNAPAAATR